MSDGHDRAPLVAELPLVAFHVAVVIGFGRVYDDGSYLGSLLWFVLGAHALAFALRRLRAPAALTIPIAAAGAVLAATWALFPDTASFGLPTAETWDAAREAMRIARALYPEVIAPTPVIAGFQLAAGLALWVGVWLADTAAHRYRTTVEPLVPGTAIFLFCSILGAGSQQILATVAFAATALWFVASQRRQAARRQQPWNQAGPTGRALAGTTGATLGLAAIAILAGVLVFPQLPGARAEPIVDWRGRGNERPSRVTVSPMVELKKRLVDQTNQLLFTVEADAPSYWRLTSLDRFDGEIWSSSGQFRSAGDRLGDAPDLGTAVEIDQTFTIEALATIWVPVAFEATELIAADRELRWDADSATLIVPDDVETSDGMTYSVTSALPIVTVDDLRGPRAADDPDDIRERYASLPADFPEVASRSAAQVTSSAGSRYEAAVALQDWFRTDFTYSTTSPAGHGDDALVDFLDSKVGYCEQFAGAFAAMARSLGMPSRVAVGFTPGIEDADQPGTFQVLGEHAHAWPEVYFAGVGWVPFEPTPGRGIPGAQDYTGVVPQQSAGPEIGPIQTSTTLGTTTTAPGAETTPATGTDDEVRTAPEAGTQASESPDDDAGWPPVVFVLALAAIAAAVVVARRRRRTARASIDEGRVDRAWSAAAATTGRITGQVQDGAETPIEYAERLDPSAGVPLQELATLITALRWAPGQPDEASVERAEELAAQIVASET